MTETRQKIVDEIKAYACETRNYTNGWDCVVETLTDDQIATLTGKTVTFAGARARVSKWVRTDPKFLCTLPDDFYDA